MAKKKKQIKAKEPVRIRFKELANGNKSIYLDIYNDGKRVYEFLKLYLIQEVDAAAKAQNKNTLQAANAIKAQRLIELTNNKADIKSNSHLSKMLLIDWIRAFKKKQQQKGVSASNCEPLITVLTAYQADKVRLQDIDKAFCVGFIQFVSREYISQIKKKTLSSVTANKICYCLDRVIKEAVKADVLHKNPFDIIDATDKIKVIETPRAYLSINEIKQLIATPCKHEALKQAYLFSCYCGLRISDIKKLTWGDIYKDGEQYRIEIVMQKTKEPIYLPLSAEALKWLPQRGTANNNDKVFNLPSKATIARGMEAWAEAAAINKHITFHTSRHTFATMMLTLGVDLYTTSKLLGHTKIETTQIYGRIVNKKKDEAVNLVNGLFD